MLCPYFSKRQCQSCELLSSGDVNSDYKTVLAKKMAQLKDVLSDWPLDEKVVESPPEHFRNKAKMAVGGTSLDPILGIPARGKNPEHEILSCPIHDKAINRLLPILKSWITRLKIEPYDIHKKQGELKFILLSKAPGEKGLMLRFVLRSKEALDRIRNALPQLQSECEGVSLVSVNLQPAHSALIEGEEEIILSTSDHLPARIGDVELLLAPRSFYQTNDHVASELYMRAASYLSDGEGERAVDLYCGVGGFAFHLAKNGWCVDGFEVSGQSVSLAKKSLEHGSMALKVSPNFYTMDLEQETPPQWLDYKACVVNPPRRGLSPVMVEKLRHSNLERVAYSSCDPLSLKRDLLLLEGKFKVEKIIAFDMFPWTRHWECLALLRSH